VILYLSVLLHAFDTIFAEKNIKSEPVLKGKEREMVF
jgi:hypothetical protein